ncbi:hypothetical protein QLQ12_33210 [Actinoplanes sp. NEAU-A12]|uniref:TonB C-terminal domain-containing protein n=1 Tax=Actinoplanes sandaracinus TaxID=3045177 RepID=A0ABT6WUQ6_9ACTN|nr:hypothetical protein [Actinoplanes sandaracinus]MDI6103480.1 hypothetical protein [Actinoplanes sandaracinus]
MTMSRKSLFRGTRGVALLVGLAGFAVSTAWPAGAALASDPADKAATQVASAAAQAAPALATGQAVTTAPAPDGGQAPATGPAPAGAAPASGPALANGPGLAEPVATGQIAPHGYQAVAVSVERTRGRHHQSVFQVSGGAKPAAAVLRLASSPAFRSLRPHYMPPSKSGRYRYEVTVHYRNGKAKRVVTYSNTPSAPKVLLDVIRGVETMPTPSFPPGFPFTGGLPFS